MNRTMSIAHKRSKELVRDRRTMLFLLLFPAMFIIVFSVAFSNSNGNATYTIYIVNEDQGVQNFPHQGNHTDFGDSFLKLLRDLRYTDSSGDQKQLIYDVRTETKTYAAEDRLKKGEADMMVIIPGNFSLSLAAEMRSYLFSHIPSGDGSQVVPFYSQVDPNVTSELVVKGDRSKQNYQSAESILNNVLVSFKDGLKSSSIESANYYLNSQGSSLKLVEAAEKVAIDQAPLSGTKSLGPFDYMVPGIIVFGIMMGAINVTVTMAEERENETLKRLKISKMNSFDLLMGTLIPYVIMAMLQVFVLLGFATILGFEPNPNGSLILAGAIGIMGGFATVSLGLMLSAFASSPRQANPFGTLIVVPMSFLTGAFFNIPNPTIIPDLFGVKFGVLDLLPWRQAVQSLIQVLTFGESFTDVMPRLIIMTVEIVILFALGVFLYRRNQLKAE